MTTDIINDDDFLHELERSMHRVFLDKSPRAPGERSRCEPVSEPVSSAVDESPTSTSFATKLIAEAGGMLSASNPGHLSSPKNFVYRDLGQKHLIRLLCLLPGGKNDELNARLFHCSMKKAPPYEALSYVWGSEQKPYHVHIQGGGRLKITASLRTALIRSRHSEQWRILWVDGICIDQSNNRERSEQVLLMRYIFSNAQRVLIWLGSDDDGSGARVLNLLRKLSRTDFATLTTKSISDEWRKIHRLPSVDHSIWIDCIRFWQRPWFRRVWIVQEFIKAKNPWMLCGSSEVECESISHGVEMLEEYGLMASVLKTRPDLRQECEMAFLATNCLRIMFQCRQTSSMGSYLANTIRTYSTRDASALPELYRGQSSKSPWFPFLTLMVEKCRADSGRRAYMLEDPATLEFVCRLFFDSFGSASNKLDVRFHLLSYLTTVARYQQATDPRDRLFAVLGLAQEAEDPRFKPDYDESLHDVGMRYATAMLETQNELLHILYYAGCLGRTSTLPSWVPDWTAADQNIGTNILAYSVSTSHTYGAADDLEWRLRVCDMVEDALIMGGSFLGTVETVLEPADALIAMAREVDRGHGKLIEEIYHFTGEDAIDALWRTMIGNLSSRNHVPAENWRGDSIALGSVLGSLGDHVEKSSIIEHLQQSEFFARLVISLGRYVLVMLNNELIGLVPTGTEVGDLIFLPSGSKAPFALRRYRKTPGEYEILAVCYIHGVMFEKERRNRSQFWQEEEIRIR